ncbi:acetate--CoA ligase family protein [Gudongella sp. DL1XJH-153]|uniref:acetate--CoA ligase family protein n=1 Tax=Gudongella sp. DL1XJH-153 TaxID=3409804 RepID=UPI003BB5D84D
MNSKLLHDPVNGRLRVIGFVSGSGNTLWKALELEREITAKGEECPFEIVGVFSSRPDAKARITAEAEGIPYASLDIKEFHKKHDAPISDMEVRALFDTEVAKLIEPFGADIILLAGYVWATTNVILDKYKAVNVHPADLSVMEGNERIFAGANGVGDTISHKYPDICSSSHIATNEVDGGPLLMLSPSFEIDYEIGDEEILKRTVLKEVNNQSRHLGARTIYEIAMGNFSLDEQGKVNYKNNPVPRGVKINSWEENKPVQLRTLDGFLNPKSVVVIGASAKGGIGNALIKNINRFGFKGNTYVVNRSGDPVDGVPAYTSVEELEETPDLAIITTPSSGVESAVEECGKKGTKSIVCISAGFKETGEEGEKAELRVKEIVDRYNMRLLGPNGMGILNTDPDVNLNATMLYHLPRKGNIALVTQSGAIGAALLDYADEFNLGFSKIASLGNLMDIDASDLMGELKDDPQTSVIMLYLETIPNGLRFLKVLKETCKSKSVVVLKSGRSEAGALAATSHTGSIAGSDSAVDALIEKAGAIRVDSLEMLYMTAMALSKLERFNGKKIGVVTNAGGPGILITDRLAKNGFQLPVMSDETRSLLAEKLYPEAATGNPIDVIAAGPPEHYALSLEMMGQSGLYDALALVCVPPATIDTGEVAEACAPVISKLEIPVLSCFIGPSLGKPARDVLNRHDLPVVEYPEMAADILKLVNDKGEQSSTDLNKKIDYVRKTKANLLLNEKYSSGYLKTENAMELLELYEIPVAKWTFIRDEEDLEDIKLSFPIVAKVEHEKVIHKSDEGGVILNIKNMEDLKNAVKNLSEKFAGLEGIFLQEQANIGMEMIVGAKFEPTVGHICLLGAGGVAVELYKDVSMKIPPLEDMEVKEMLQNLKSYKLFTGFRGSESLPEDQFIDLVVKFSDLIMENSQIAEMDINPVAWDSIKKQFVALDCRIKA